MTNLDIKTHFNSNNVLLTLDIGNTAITYGLFRGVGTKSLLKRSGTLKYSDIPKLNLFFNKSGKKISKNIIISSVVPEITKKIHLNFSKKERFNVLEVGKDIKIPISHQYSKKSKLGADRLVTLYGAKRLYKTPLLVVDFGTAITFDYLSAKGNFEGGMIIPGPETSFQALLKKAALIPSNLRLPKRRGNTFLGNSTYDCICAGTLEGYGAMTDELINRFKSKYGKNLKIIITGGFAKNLKRLIKSKATYNPNLSIQALNLLFSTANGDGA